MVISSRLLYCSNEQYPNIKAIKILFWVLSYASWGSWGSCSTLPWFQNSGCWGISIPKVCQSQWQKEREHGESHTSTNNFHVEWHTPLLLTFFGQVSLPQLISKGWGHIKSAHAWQKNQKYLVNSISNYHKYVLWWLILCINFAGPQCLDIWSNIILDVLGWDLHLN